MSPAAGGGALGKGGGLGGDGGLGSLLGGGGGLGDLFGGGGNEESFDNEYEEKKVYK